MELFKKHPFLAKNPIDRFILHFSQFSAFFSFYIHKKVVIFSTHFEKNKNRLVKFFMMKRGRYSRPFLHVSAMGVLILGVIVSPLIGESYPIFSSESATTASADTQKQSIIIGEDVFTTNVSKKPRDKIINYTVQKGDTLSTISNKFDVTVETIQWENDINGENLNIGQSIRILPVSGISHEVKQGETIYSIAKKYDTNPQKVADFPFNDFANPETFSLTTSQALIVPDGIKPSEQPTYVRPSQPIYVQGPGNAVGASGIAWPIQGGISQNFSWYHPGLDISAAFGIPVYAAQSGTVSNVSVGTWAGGYGNNITITNGSTTTLYAHLNTINVSPGQTVVAGQTVIATNGSTGRSTGPHVHLELIQNGSKVNPLNYL